VAHLKHWWAKKYRLPPNHDLFENQSIAELNLEFYEDLFVRRKEIMEEMEDQDVKGDSLDRLFKQLNAINRILGFEEQSGDPLIDEWERDLAEGRIPDLEKR